MTNESPSHKPTTTPSLLKVGALVSCDTRWDHIPMQHVLGKPSERGVQSPGVKKTKNKSMTRVSAFVFCSFQGRTLEKSTFHLV